LNFKLNNKTWFWIQGLPKCGSGWETLASGSGAARADSPPGAGAGGDFRRQAAGRTGEARSSQADGGHGHEDQVRYIQ